MLMLLSGNARSDELSILFLPTYVQSDDNVISMHADYGGVDSSGRIPVYIVNRTDSPVTLNDNGRALNIKLEFLGDDGNWIRAQPHYPQSGCIVYYYDDTIHPGHFIVVDGYQHINGEAKQVRYRLRSNDVELVTNIGQGMVAAIDIEQASRDAMAIDGGDFELVSMLALEKAYAVNDRFIEYGRYLAIDALATGRFDLDESRSVLKELAILRPDLNRETDWAIDRLDIAKLKMQERP